MEADHVNVEHPTEELVTRLGEGGGGGQRGVEWGSGRQGWGVEGGGEKRGGVRLGKGAHHTWGQRLLRGGEAEGVGAEGGWGRRGLGQKGVGAEGGCGRRG